MREPQDPKTEGELHEIRGQFHAGVSWADGPRTALLDLAAPGGRGRSEPARRNVSAYWAPTAGGHAASGPLITPEGSHSMVQTRPRALLLGLAATLLAGLLIAATSQAASLPTLTVAITPSSASVGGALESGAVNISASDTGVKEGSVIIFRLGKGVTLAEVESFAASKKATHDPNNSSPYGSLVWDAEVNPGGPVEAATVLQPGQYVVLVGESEKPVQLRTHFVVAAAKAPAALPAPAATEKTIDFGFKGPSTLHDGELVAFENEGWLVHMDFAFPVKNMRAARAVVKALLTGREKGLQKYIAGAPVGFAGPLSHGGMQEETISAKPGIYVQVCFMATQDGRVHTRLGMERIITIKK